MKVKLALSILVITGLLLAGCIKAPGEGTTRLGEEVSLSIGQTAAIEGEDLEITFEEVLEDSRCPRDVFCVWAGQVRCLVRVTYKGILESLELVEPGLLDQANGVSYQDYWITYHVLPYPEASKEIKDGDYRLMITVTETGRLHGLVTIGPLSPVEQPGEKPPVPCEVYQARRIMVYDEHGSKLILEVAIDCDGRYSTALELGIYTVDINRTGIDFSDDVPKQVDITAGQTTRLDIDIDTGIR